MEFDPSYKQPYVRTGDWFITLLITKIPIVGLIMLIVWAVDKEGNPSKSNWAKAKLIWYAVGFGILLFFLFIIGFGTFMGLFDHFNFPDF